MSKNDQQAADNGAYGAFVVAQGMGSYLTTDTTTRRTDA